VIQVDSTPPDDESLAGRIRALLSEAEVVASRGDVQNAAVILEELLKIDNMVLAESDISVVRNVLDIAGILLPTGPFAEVEQVCIKTISVLAKHRQAAIADSFVPLNNLAALYDRIGAPDRRNQINEMIIVRSEQITEPIDYNTMMVLLSLVQLYKSAGRTKATAILYRPVYRYSLSNPLPPELRLSIIHSFGDALIADGRARDAVEMYGESLTCLEAMPGFTEEQRMALLLLRGTSAKAAGALVEAEQALKLAEAVALRTQPDSSEAGVIYHTLATLYLDLRHDRRGREATGARLQNRRDHDGREFCGIRRVFGSTGIDRRCQGRL
jgi:hypothetical protein